MTSTATQPASLTRTEAPGLVVDDRLPLLTFGPEVDGDGVQTLLVRLVGLCFDVEHGDDGDVVTLVLVTAGSESFTGTAWNETGGEHGTGDYDGPTVTIAYTDARRLTLI